MKEPGQIAFEASGCFANDWRGLPISSKRTYAAMEFAVLASAKPERPSGVWVTFSSHQGWVPLRAVQQVGVLPRENCCYVTLGGGSPSISEADARKIVHALGGEWLEAER